MEPDGRTNLDCLHGSVSLLFSPDWNSGDGIGNWGTLLEAGTWDADISTATGAWGLYISPDASTVYFSAQTNGFSTNLLNAPIAWNAGEWHSAALTYTATNSALYLDGALAATGTGVTVNPGTNATTFSIGSDGNAGGTGLLQARGVFADVATYDYPLTGEAISNNYTVVSELVYPLPSSGGFSADFGPPPLPGGGGGTPEGGGSGGSGYTPVDYGTNLWLGITGITDHLAGLFLTNTASDILYEIQGQSDPTQSNWISEGFVSGSELTNWTMVNVPATNSASFVYRIRSWMDSGDTGIPDWWWFQYFGQNTNVDASAEDPAGDGYSNLQKFQMGLNPTNYYNPNPPGGFYGYLGTNGTDVYLLWNSAPGPVVNYLVQRGVFDTNTSNYVYSQVGTVSSNGNLASLKTRARSITAMPPTTFTIWKRCMRVATCPVRTPGRLLRTSVTALAGRRRLRQLIRLCGCDRNERPALMEFGCWIGDKLCR